MEEVIDLHNADSSRATQEELLRPVVRLIGTKIDDDD